MADYYRVLGVKKDASADEIKAAYRKLAKKYHPDVTGGDKTAEKKFLEVGEAYETLSDPEKRKAYDERRDNPPLGRPGARKRGAYDPFAGFAGAKPGDARGAFSFDDILGDLFGGRSESERPRQMLDVLSQCDIPPWVAALGGRIEVRVSDKTLSVKIPPNVRSGQRLRLRGQGLGDGHGKTGDLLIELTIQNPETVTPEMRKLYEQMARAGG